MSNKNQWIIDIGTNDEYWASELGNIPSMITYSYRMLRNLAKEGNVYGVLLQIRDVYEYILRVPTIMALVIIESDPKYKDVKGYDKVISTMLEAPMSMGRWYEVAGKVKKQNKALNLPKNLIQILSKTRELYSTEISEDSSDVVNWRNDTIGHGFLKFEDDLGYREEAKTLINMLKNYFDNDSTNSIGSLYEGIFLVSGKDKLKGECFKIDCKDTELALSVEGYEYNVSHFLYGQDIRFYLFDSYYSRKNLMRYSSYIDGQTDIKKDKYFHDLFVKYVLRGNSDSAISSDYVSNEDEALMEYLHMPINYIKPIGLISQLEEALDELEHGVITIQMERGTGKSAFANRMNGLYHKRPLISDSFVRCYHIQNAALRGISDFANIVKDSFTHNYDGSRIVSANDELQSISIDSENPAQSMADFLNYYHKKYKKDYSILVLDGIDELAESTKIILDFVPKQNQLDEGVFVIMTTRFPDEASVGDDSKKYINKAISIADSIISMRRKETANRDVLEAFINSYKEQGLIGDIDLDAAQLIKKSDYRFLYLKAYLEIKGTVSLDVSNESAFIDSYMNHITTHYSLTQNQLIREIAVSIALFPGISIEKYQEFISSREITYNFIGLLNDLMPLLTAVHMNGETQYIFADQAYSDYILEKYKDDAVRVISGLLIRIQDYKDKPYDGWLQDTGYTEDNVEYQTIDEQNREQQSIATLLYNSISFLEKTGMGEVLFAKQNVGSLGWVSRLYYGRFVSPYCEALRYEILNKSLRLNLESLLKNPDIDLYWLYNLYDRMIERDTGLALEDQAISENIVKAVNVISERYDLEACLYSLIHIVNRKTIPSFIMAARANCLTNIVVEKIWEIWYDNCLISYVEKDKEEIAGTYWFNGVSMNLKDKHKAIYFEALRGEQTKAIGNFYTVNKIWKGQREDELEMLLRFISFCKAFDGCDDISLVNKKKLKVMQLLTYMFALGDYENGKQCLCEIDLSEVEEFIHMDNIFKDYLKNCASGTPVDVETFLSSKRNEPFDLMIKAVKQAVYYHDFTEINIIFEKITDYEYEEADSYNSLLRYIAQEYSNFEKEEKERFFNTVNDIILIDVMESCQDVMKTNNKYEYEKMWDRYIAGAQNKPDYPDDYETINRLLVVLSNLYTINNETEKNKKIWKEYTTIISNKANLLGTFFTPNDYNKYKSLFAFNQELAYCALFMDIRLAGLMLTNNHDEALQLKEELDETNDRILNIILKDDLFGHDPHEYGRYYKHLSRLCEYLAICMRYGLLPKKSGGAYMKKYALPLQERVMTLIKDMDSSTSFKEAREMIRITLAHNYLTRHYDDGLEVCESFMRAIRSKTAERNDLISSLSKLSAYVEFAAEHFRFLQGNQMSTEGLKTLIDVINPNRVHYKGVDIGDAFFEGDYVVSQMDFAKDCAAGELKEKTAYTHKILIPTENKIMDYYNKLF